MSRTLKILIKWTDSNVWYLKTTSQSVRGRKWATGEPLRINRHIHAACISVTVPMYWCYCMKCKFGTSRRLRRARAPVHTRLFHIPTRGIVVCWLLLITFANALVIFFFFSSIKPELGRGLPAVYQTFTGEKGQKPPYTWTSIIRGEKTILTSF